MRWLSSVWITARYELTDAVRSRRAAVILVLYLAGAMLTCNGFISVLHKLELQLTDVLGISSAASPGAVVDALWENREFQRMVEHLVGDHTVATQLLTIPPLALVYGWLAFTFTPILVMLSTSVRIAEEVSSGSVRFAMLRTSRLAWCMGKFLGQAMMLIVALLLSVVGAWCVARFRLTSLSDLNAAGAMIVYAGKAWLYSLAFIGLALGLSQMTRRPYQAMALGFLVWILCAFLSLACKHFAGEGMRQLWTVAGMLIPQGHRMDLWRTDAAHLLSGGMFLLSLAFSYLLAGYAWFARTDL